MFKRSSVYCDAVCVRAATTGRSCACKSRLVLRSIRVTLGLFYELCSVHKLRINFYVYRGGCSLTGVPGCARPSVAVDVASQACRAALVPPSRCCVLMVTNVRSAGVPFRQVTGIWYVVHPLPFQTFYLMPRHRGKLL
jgi:hypothetical protein